MGFPGGITREMAERARKLAGVNVRDDAHVGRVRERNMNGPSDPQKLQAETATRLNAINYYLGDNHTSAPEDRTGDARHAAELRMARDAVLSTLHEFGMLATPLPARVIERLFTADERKICRVSFTHPVGGQVRTEQVAIPFDLTGA